MHVQNIYEPLTFNLQCGNGPYYSIHSNGLLNTVIRLSSKCLKEIDRTTHAHHMKIESTAKLAD